MEQEFYDAYGAPTHTFQLNSCDAGALLVMAGKQRGDSILKDRDFPIVGLRILKTIAGGRKDEIYKFVPEEGEFDSLRTRIDILEEVLDAGEPVVSTDLIARMEGLKV
jgi:hypothetical protein